jgi:tetratricopeptide (TPR) repeat protein
MTMSRLPTFLILAVSLLCNPASAQQGDGGTQRARELFQRAEEHYKAERFEQALQLYSQAYKIKPLAGFLFNLGQCERQLGRCEKALVHFREFLRRLPEAPNRAMVDDLILECEAAVTEKEKGTAPPEPAPAPVPAPPADPEEKVTVVSSKGAHPAWFWTSASLGGLLLVTGTVTGILTLGMNDEYKEATSRDRQLDLRDSGRITGRITDVTLAAGAAAAVAAAVLYFFTDWSPEEARLSASDGGALGLTVSF